MLASSTLDSTAAAGVVIITIIVIISIIILISTHTDTVKYNILCTHTHV